MKRTNLFAPLPEDQHIKPMQPNARTSANLSRISRERPPPRNDRPMRPIARNKKLSYEGTGY